MDAKKYAPYGPRLAEIPFLFEHLLPGSVLNIGGARSPWFLDMIERCSKMAIVDVRPIQHKHKRCQNIQRDIRELSPNETSLVKYDNVILLSTLEHIGLELFPAAQTEKNIRQEQLKIFGHCMGFLKPGGHMLFTVPCGYPQPRPKHKLLYSKTMIEDIKAQGQVLAECYAVARNNRKTAWDLVAEYPQDKFLYEHSERLSNDTRLLTNVVAMLVMTDKK